MTPSTFISLDSGRSTSATVSDDTVDVAARSWCADPMISASDLSELSCRPFCMYDVGSTCGKNGQSGGCVVGAHCEAKLCVVSILVVLNTVACNDVSNWTGVDSEQDGSQY